MTTATTVHYPTRVEHFGPDPDRPGYLAVTVDDTIVGDELHPDDVAQRLIDAAVAWFRVADHCPLCAHDAIGLGDLPTAWMEPSGPGTVCPDCGAALSADDEWALPGDVDEALADELHRTSPRRLAAVAR